MKRHRDVVWLVLLLLLAAGFGMARAMQPRPVETRHRRADGLTFMSTKGQFAYRFELSRHRDGPATYAAVSGKRWRDGKLDSDTFNQLMDRLDEAGVWRLDNRPTGEVGYTTYTLILDGPREHRTVAFGGPLDATEQRVMNVLTDSVVYQSMFNLGPPVQ